MNFPLKLNIRIDWSEMDLFSHVNNVAFMKYVQAGRVTYWEQIGLTKMHTDLDHGPMLASTACTFLKPLHYPGSIIIQTRLEFIKTTSFGLHHQIVNEKKEVCAEAHDVVVMFDFGKGQKMEIPEEIRKNIETTEK